MNHTVYHFIKSIIEKSAPIRFVIVGGSVAVLQLAMLYVFHAVLGIASLWASIIAFVISVFINFGFQKFWSFQDPSRDRMHQQFGYFILNACGNLAINALLMSLLLQAINTYIAQAFTLIFIAFFNFTVYKIIFRYKRTHPVI